MKKTVNFLLLPRVTELSDKMESSYIITDEETPETKLLDVIGEPSDPINIGNKYSTVLNSDPIPELLNCQLIRLQNSILGTGCKIIKDDKIYYLYNSDRYEKALNTHKLPDVITYKRIKNRGNS